MGPQWFLAFSRSFANNYELKYITTPLVFNKNN